MWIAYQAVADLQRHMPVAKMVAGPCQQQRVAAACLGHRFCSRPDAHDQTVLAAQEITVPQNLAELSDALLDPLGISLVSEQDADAQGVNQAVFGAMQARFDGQAGAFAYLLFVLLYFPCVATIGAIRRETGSGWAAFVATWTTGIAYLTATIFYQAATWDQHPSASLTWIGGLLLVFVATVIGLRVWARRGRRRVGAIDWAEQ